MSFSKWIHCCYAMTLMRQTKEIFSEVTELFGALYEYQAVCQCLDLFFHYFSDKILIFWGLKEKIVSVLFIITMCFLLLQKFSCILLFLIHYQKLLPCNFHRNQIYHQDHLEGQESWNPTTQMTTRPLSVEMNVLRKISNIILHHDN